MLNELVSIVDEEYKIKDNLDLLSNFPLSKKKKLISKSYHFVYEILIRAVVWFFVGQTWFAILKW